MADLSDLKREWDSQPEYPEKKLSEIANLVRTRSDSMRSMLSRRDAGEGIAGLFISAVFAGYWIMNPALLAPNAIAKTGIVIVIAGCVGIFLLMRFVRRRNQLNFASVPLKEFVASEIEALNGQVWLLRHVAWWYLAPAYVGSCVYVFGLSSSGEWDPYRIFFIGYAIGALVLYYFIWRLNQTARRTTLEPLRDALQRTYNSLASDSDSSEPESELISALTRADLTCKGGLGNIRYLKPSKLQLATIILATVGGGFCGYWYPLPGMGPRPFQSMIGAILGFEITFFGFCVRFRSKKEQNPPGSAGRT
jgi:hypothetical protein